MRSTARKGRQKEKLVKKLVFMVVTLALMMLVVVPVIASSTSDLEYLTSIRSEYMDKINDQGQTMIFDDIQLVEKGSPYSFPLTVGTGDYEIWGISGPGIRDLNIHIYSANGSLLSESIEAGNYPTLSFTEPVSRSHKVVVDISDFESGINAGYFLIIVIKTN
jgi:hypothetical protein